MIIQFENHLKEEFKKIGLNAIISSEKWSEKNEVILSIDLFPLGLKERINNKNSLKLKVYKKGRKYLAVWNKFKLSGLSNEFADTVNLVITRALKKTNEDFKNVPF